MTAITCRAARCHAYGPPSNLAIETVSVPDPGPGEARVRVHAVGINFFDGLMVAGKYQIKPPFPFSPGSEIAGTVESVGPDVDPGWLGQRVFAFAFHGAYAEVVVLPVRLLHRTPATMDDVAAAAFPCVYGTSYHALKDRAHLQPGETLLVLGAAGGVGLAAVELGKCMGARVIAGASSPEKLALCRAHGADETIDYAREDLRERIKALTNGRGIDVVYDPVGGALAEPAIRSLAIDGRFLVIGFAAGEIPRIPLNLLLLKSASAVGVFWGAFTEREPLRHQANVAELLAWQAAGRLEPHIHGTWPLERAVEALESVMNRQVQGKAILVMDSAAGADA
jgi:NADPH2:quinone reductase